MFTNCAFCGEPLGSNRALRTLPVGTRIAVDRSGGKCWVICVRCGEWNLTPLEDRAAQLLEYSLLGKTSGAGVVSKLPDGLEVLNLEGAHPAVRAKVRFGRGLRARARFTAWRWTSYALLGMGAAGIAVYLVRHRELDAAAAGVVAAAFVLLRIAFASALHRQRLDSKAIALDLSPFGSDARLAAGALDRVTIQRSPAEPGLELTVTTLHSTFRLRGGDVLLALRRLLPLANPAGGDDTMISTAVADIERRGGADAFLCELPNELAREGLRYTGLSGLPQSILLRIEIAVTEILERPRKRLAESVLVEQHRQANEVACIADALVPTPEVADALTVLSRLSAPISARARAG